MTSKFIELTTLLIVVTSALATPPAYKITDLGTLGGTSSSAKAVNNNGQVVGHVNYSDGSSRPFRYEEGNMTLLSPLHPGDPGAGVATDINDYGQITGYSYTFSGPGSHAFLTSNGTLQDLGTLGGATSTATSINNYGTVVGSSWMQNNSLSHAFIYDGQSMVDIHKFGGNYSRSSADYINNNGIVVGSTTYAGSVDVHDRHAFIYQNGIMTDIGTLGGKSSFASAINDFGQIVGYSYNSANQRYPFLYENGTMKKIAVFGAYANDINNHGQIALSSYLYEEGTAYSLLSLLDANPGWSYLDSYSINDFGWIAGAGYNPDGDWHAFLMTPVPEPAAMGLLVIGAVMIRKRAKGKR